MDDAQPAALQRLWGWADHRHRNALDTAARKRFMALCGLQEIAWDVSDSPTTDLDVTFEQFSAVVQALPPATWAALMATAQGGALPRDEGLCLAARRLLFKFLGPRDGRVAAAALAALLRSHGAVPGDAPEWLDFAQCNSILALLPWRPMAEADALNGLRLLWRSAHRDRPAVSGAEYRAFLARFDFQAVAVDEAPKSVTDFQQTVQGLPDVGRNVFLSLGALLASLPCDLCDDLDDQPVRRKSLDGPADPLPGQPAASGESCLPSGPTVAGEELLTPVDAEVGLRVLFDFLDPDCRGHVPAPDLKRLGIHAAAAAPAPGLVAWPQFRTVLDGHRGLRADEAQTLKGMWALWQWCGLGAISTSAEERQQFLSRLGLHLAPPAAVADSPAFFTVWQWLRARPASETGDVFAACAVLAHLQAAAVAAPGPG